MSKMIEFRTGTLRMGESMVWLKNNPVV